MDEGRAQQLALPLTGALLHRIMRFGRALREAGIGANPGRLTDFVASLPHVGLRRRDDFYYAARATLMTRPDQRDDFDRIFALYWPSGYAPISGAADGPDGAPGSQSSPESGEGAPDAADGAPVDAQRFVPAGASGRPDEDADTTPRDARGPHTAVMSYSQEEILRDKNFGDFTEEELLRARRLMERMRWRIARRLTRRAIPARQGDRLDLRRTVRRSFSTGGETLSWAQRRPKLKPRPIVLICDVSGSMERYTSLLLQFLHTVSHGTGATVETFVFATRLTRVTPALRRRRVDDALARVAEEVADWSGGTRTGEALAVFNRVWARRVLGRGAVAMIISDGWDRGDVQQLDREMARLRRTSYRLLWLNPLLGSPHYRPLTRGMQAALPYLDGFLPVHNLNSLEALVDTLAALPLRRSSDRGARRSPHHWLRLTPASPASGGAASAGRGASPDRAPPGRTAGSPPARRRPGAV